MPFEGGVAAQQVLQRGDRQSVGGKRRDCLRRVEINALFGKPEQVIGKENPITARVPSGNVRYVFATPDEML
jgi:hypothetical protein